MKSSDFATRGVRKASRRRHASALASALAVLPMPAAGIESVVVTKEVKIDIAPANIDLEAVVSGKNVTLTVIARARSDRTVCFGLGDINSVSFIADDGSQIPLAPRARLRDDEWTGSVIVGDGHEHRYLLSGEFTSPGNARRVVKAIYHYATYDCLNMIIGPERVGFALSVEATPVFKERQ
jgi:hypothetical protein